MIFVVVLAISIVSAVSGDQQELNLSSVKKPIAPSQTWGDNKIVNGYLASRRQFPYQVGLWLDYGNGGELSWCGGTLISDEWVLTAAHCTDGVVGGEVILGATDRTKPKQVGQTRIHIDKSNIFIHEDWDVKTFQNDISLIQLPCPVELSAYIKPANLPKIEGNHSDYLGAKVIASGWGRINDANKIGADKLQWIKVPVMLNSACRSYYNSPVVGDEHICISAENGKSICNGDSGGPLVLADGSRTVVGITSFGLSTSCEKSFPGVFTRVTSFLDWIEEISGVVNE